ncbi:MAG TPA: FAD-dependent oxidoreductase [Alphaproteobacteria bacterium]|nr:FAD-dependent oxidoreductase [Alphaproteobacteria bacterium]
MYTDAYDVVIAGGGPAGLVLAMELGRRSVSCLLVDDKPGTTTQPRANATQARTMEHYRRLGFAHEIRPLGLPLEYPTDMVCCTRLAGYELARYKRPSTKEATQSVRNLSGSWSTPELPHRCALIFVEPILLKHARKFPSVEIQHEQRAVRFRETPDRVEVDIDRVDGKAQRTVRAKYFVGCEGAKTIARRQLGIKMQGELASEREWMAGKMHTIYFRSPQLFATMNRPTAWMYFTVNKDRRSVLVAVNGTDTFTINAQLKRHEQDEAIGDTKALEMFEQALGTRLPPVEIIGTDTWLGGYMLVAERYGSGGRVVMAGDAVHLFTPTGGLGYNTAVDDVCNLGWKLAALTQGWGGPRLLASYESERRPIGLRNTSLAKTMADRIGLYRTTTTLEEDSPAGAAERKRAGDHLLDHLMREFNIPGVTFGVRYDGSPIVVSDGTAPPPDLPNEYVPSACPGGRAPHHWLPDGASLFDRFGRDFTLLVTGADSEAARGFTQAAEGLHIPLSVLHLPLPELRELYAADLALIRPDQHVAWRGSTRSADPAAVLRQATGH